MNQITYQSLLPEDITLELFQHFNRYQEVKRCWRKENNQWVLKDIAFTEQWGQEEFKILVSCLQNTAKTGGIVLGAFLEHKLVGFASLENEFFGSQNQYLQLSSIHVSNEMRGSGIGKVLFLRMSALAKEKGAKKLYISTHSSEETQAFYKAVGCVEALEYNRRIAQAEPCDCQLEYVLS